jgi:hypothetical protein
LLASEPDQWSVRRLQLASAELHLVEGANKYYPADPLAYYVYFDYHCIYMGVAF